MEQPALFLDLVLVSCAVAFAATMVFLAGVAIVVVRRERRRPLPEVDAENVRRLADELRALANEVSALAKDEPKERASVT